jgi:hypothetical protein
VSSGAQPIALPASHTRTQALAGAASRACAIQVFAVSKSRSADATFPINAYHADSTSGAGFPGNVNRRFIHRHAANDPSR